MKWLYEKQRMKDKIKKISGLRFTFLSLFHLVLLTSTHLGKHFSIGIGMGSLEIAVAIMACAIIFWLWINFGGGRKP